MRFKELTLIEEERNDTFTKFEMELEKFRLAYNTIAFEVDYIDRDHLLVTTENILEYPEEVHNKLCEHFDVKLTYVNKLNQQSSRGHYLTVEYVYQPTDCDEEELEWRNIQWL